ncbi:MAG: type II toxin-antitoxin system RelE/ParE family toxin [Candidatus Nanopelagicaceae bacterium]|nr:type II toxin-antitoxin system RelE/ParE family toxin [Candidatus Nanopelagicaceae bacterium]
MKYRLRFEPEALKEWNSLDRSIRIQFAKKLESRLEEPVVKSSELSGELKGLYKIKLASLGYRLVYQIESSELTVVVISVGKRDKSYVYTTALERKKKTPPPK